MTAIHLSAGGGTASIITLAIVWACNRFLGLHLSDSDAVIIGAAALAFGTGLASRIERYGIRGIASGIWRGHGTTV